MTDNPSWCPDYEYKPLTALMSTENIKLNEIWNTKSWKYHLGFRKYYNKYSFFLASTLGKTNKFEKRNPYKWISLMAMINMDVTDFHWKKYFSASHDQFLRMIVIIVWFWIFHVCRPPFSYRFLDPAPR